jgi:glycosyltransferase involved in cell wall biosynthesis
MKVLLLSDSNSEHTEKWALGLAQNGIEVGLFSFNKASYPWYNRHANITLLYETEDKLESDGGVLSKLSYLKLVGKLKQSIRLFKPDILHAHYATSYGLVGALSGFSPFIISAWGTDVMKFPQSNFINKAILRYNFKKADVICATSHTIEEYIHQVIDKDVKVVPFGVDITVFKPKQLSTNNPLNEFVVGSIKPLESLYNVDILIKAFYKVKTEHPELPLKLLIVGEGSEAQKLKKIADELNFKNSVVFTGRIPFDEISNYFNQLDVLVNVSDYESFGVSVVEAMACEKAVIVTNVGGFKEVVENENYGSLVNIRNVDETAEAIKKYIFDKDLKVKVGQNARKKVIALYNWENNVKEMIAIYSQTIDYKK